MPQQYNPANNGLDFSDAPGGSLSLDDLFPIEEESLSSQSPAVEPSSQPNAAPQSPTPSDDVFLRAGETIYKTREDALNGITHKDSVINELRARLASQTGVDPITNKPIAAQSQQIQQVQPPAPTNYATDQSRYFDDLVDAVQKQDKARYAQIQQKLIQDTFAPVAPLLVDVAKSRAVDNVASEIPDFKTFQSTPAYYETLDLMPSLKEAIQMGETYIDAAQRLPELYRIAYYAGQGRRVPELVRAAAQQTPAVNAAPAQPVRPTQAPSTLNPPTPAPPPDLRTSEGRRQLIAEAERRGVADLRF